MGEVTITILGLAMVGIWIAASVYGEAHRDTSAFWRGWTDISGWRFIFPDKDNPDA